MTVVVLVRDEIGSRRLLSRLPDRRASVLDSWDGQIPLDGSDSSQVQLVANFIQGKGECLHS